MTIEPQLTVATSQRKQMPSSWLLVGLLAMGEGSCSGTPDSFQAVNPPPPDACVVARHLLRADETAVVWKRVLKLSKSMQDSATRVLGLTASSESISSFTFQSDPLKASLYDNAACPERIVGFVDDQEGPALFAQDPTKKSFPYLSAVYPTASGILQFSGVGFSTDRREAVFCASLRRPGYITYWGVFLSYEQEAWEVARVVLVGQS